MRIVKKHLYPRTKAELGAGLRNFFIPHEGNDHWPASVRHKHLWFYGGALVTLKILLVVLLFITFPTVAEFSTITQARIAELVNQTRRASNLPAVVISPTLQKAAELKLQDMIKGGYFAHVSPKGAEPWLWFKQAGYLYTYAGENLAMNFTEAEEAHSAWLASATHRANILNSNYEEIGVAVGVAEINGQPATLVVQLFGQSFVPPTIVQVSPSEATQVQGEEVVAVNQPSSEPVESPSTAVQPTPQQPLEGPLPNEPIAVSQDITGGSEAVTLAAPQRPDVVGFILKFIQDFYWVILGFVILALLLKIVIRAHIQHKRVIAHGLLVIAIGLLLLALHIHFLEGIKGPVLIF